MEYKDYEVGVDSGQMAIIPIEGTNDRVWCSGPEVDLGGPGEYDCYIDTYDSGDWGVRVSRLKLGIPGEHHIGKVVTKTGKVIISDPCYVHRDEYGAGGNYDRACNASLNSEPCGGQYAAYGYTECGDEHTEEEVGQAVCSSSGYGDGGYKCRVGYENGIAKTIEVVFICPVSEDCQDSCDGCNRPF